MVYSRGARADFDRYASYTGDTGWSWDALVRYMLKNERLVPSADGHDTSDQVDPRFHGHGPLSVSLANFPGVLGEHVIQATEEVEGFNFNLDISSGNTIGVGE